MSERPDSSVREDVQREFGARASAYVESPSHAGGSDLARLIELARPDPGTVALDVATGGGHTALALSHLTRSVVASDLSPKMLAAAAAFHRSRSISTIRYVAADSEELPFASGSFDLVTCRIAPHHFSDLDRATKEWARVLQPGGRLALEDSVVPDEVRLDRFMNDLERTRDYTHVRSYTETEWRRSIEGAGLSVVHAEGVYKEHRLEEWLDRGAMKDPQGDRSKVESMLRSAPDDARDMYRIVLDAHGRPERFADVKLILIAVKPP